MAISTEKIEIKINGKLNKAYNYLNISLTQELLKPNELRFTMQKKDLIDSEDISKLSLPKDLLGAKVLCTLQSARYDQKAETKKEKLEFNGIIFKVNAYRDEMVTELLIDVQAFSHDYLLIDHPHCFSYEEKSLSDIVKNTLNPYNIPNEISPMTTASIPYTVQYNETNYQFLTRLAQRYGEWMYYNGEKWIFGKVKKGDVIELYPRVDIHNFRFSAGLIHHTLKHAHHDYLKYENPLKTDKDVLPELKGFNELTDPARAQSESLFTKDTFQHLQCSNPEVHPEDELVISLKAQLSGTRAQQAVCTGTTLRADLRIGSLIKIKDFYDKGNNKVGYSDHDELLVCRIVHYADAEGNYRNDFMAIPSKSDFPPYFNSDAFPVIAPQRAKVIDNKDPEKLGRIRVQFLWQEKQDESLITPWIRIAQPHGGDNKGFYFIPEIDEEVMVEFENGNAEKPYVSGTLYHGKQRPGSNWYVETNDIKAIRTRNGHTIEFHDVEGQEGFIRIYDNEREKYVITCSSDEKLIKLESKGNIELHAQDDIVMTAGRDMMITVKNTSSESAGKNKGINAGQCFGIIAGTEQRDFHDKTNNDNEKGMYREITGDDKDEVSGNKETTVKKKYDISVQTDYSVKTATGDIKAKAQKKIDMSAIQVEIDATATIDVNAKGILTAKGSLVKIN